MPAWQSDIISLTNDYEDGSFWRWHTNSPLRQFYRNYAGVNVGLTYRNHPSDTSAIIFCPSRHDVVPYTASYLCTGLGVYTPDVGVGSPSITRMAQGGPNGPVIFMHERIWSAAVNTSLISEGPHRLTGGHVMLADGTLRWYDISCYRFSNYFAGLVQPLYRQIPAGNVATTLRVFYNQQFPSIYTGDGASAMRRRIWGYRE